MSDKITPVAELKRKLTQYEYDGEYGTPQENKAYRDGIDEALDKINEFEAGQSEKIKNLTKWLENTIQRLCKITDEIEALEGTAAGGSNAVITTPSTGGLAAPTLVRQRGRPQTSNRRRSGSGRGG